MANRTVKFMGYSSSPTVNVTFVFNGTEVFNGAVSNDGTLGSLFTFDIDRTLEGDVPGTVSVSGGDLTIVSLIANHSDYERVEFTDANGDLHEEVTNADVINTYEWFDNGANTSKRNIIIDGVAYDKGDTTTLSGAWHVHIADGQSMECDWVVNASILRIG